jgi:hypothetical protein
MMKCRTSTQFCDLRATPWTRDERFGVIAVNGVFCLYTAIRPILKKVTPKHLVLICCFVVSGIAVTFISDGLSVSFPSLID